MDPGEIIAILSLIIGAGVLGGAFVGAWLLGRAQGERSAARTAGEALETSARMARIEQLVDGLSTDMERLAESQRFIARRLASGEERK